MDAEMLLLMAVALAGALVTGALGWGWQSMREGGKQRQRPSQIEKENRERAQKAKEDAGKGSRRQLRGAAAIIIGFLMLFLLMLFIVAMSEGAL